MMSRKQLTLGDFRAISKDWPDNTGLYTDWCEKVYGFYHQPKSKTINFREDDDQSHLGYNYRAVRENDIVDKVSDLLAADHNYVPTTLMRAKLREIVKGIEE